MPGKRCYPYILVRSGNGNRYFLKMQYPSFLNSENGTGSHSGIPKATGTGRYQMELLSRVYDHVIHKTVKGFNMLTLGWTDGYSFVPERPL